MKIINIAGKIVTEYNKKRNEEKKIIILYGRRLNKSIDFYYNVLNKIPITFHGDEISIGS